MSTIALPKSSLLSPKSHDGSGGISMVAAVKVGAMLLAEKSVLFVVLLLLVPVVIAL